MITEAWVLDKSFMWKHAISFEIQDSWIRFMGKCIFCDDNATSQIWLSNFVDKLPAFKLTIQKNDSELIKLFDKQIGKKYGE